MHDMHALGAKLPRQALGQLPYPSPAGPIGGKLGVGPQRAQRAGEDQRALLLATRLRQGRLTVMVEEEPQRLLGEGEGTADVRLQAGGEFGVGFGQEGFLGGVLDAVDGEGELEGAEGRVRADGGEGLRQRGRRRVRGKGLNDGARRATFERLRDLLEGLGPPREEGDGEVAVRWVREDARYAGALCCASFDC